MFIEYCKTLISAALSTELPKKITNAIIKGKYSDLIINNRLVSIERHDWVGSSVDSYELKFKICLPSDDVSSREE